MAHGADEAAVHRARATASRGAIWCCSAGGLFLIYKATHELYERVERAPEPTARPAAANASPPASVATLAQILALDIVFSLDSVITAVGMARAISMMIMAMVIAVGVMFVFADVGRPSSSTATRA